MDWGIWENVSGGLRLYIFVESILGWIWSWGWSFRIDDFVMIVLDLNSVE